jgi:hypothetical protein
MVSNAQGQVALEVADAPVPSNDLFVNATVLTGVPFSETTDTSGAKRAAEDPECATYWETEKQTVWYAYTPASDAWIEANNYGSINDFTMSIGAYTGEQGSLTELACAAGDPLVAPYGAAVRIHVFAGMTYYFMIENASGYTVFNVLDATAPANDDLASAAAIGSLPYADTFAAHYATSADEDPVPSCGPAGAASGMPSVWYKYTPTKSRWLEGTAVAYPDVTVSVWTGPPGALSEVGCASAQVADQIPFRFLANRKVQYLFMVSAASSYWYGSGWGDAAFTLEAGPRPLKGEVNVVKASVDRAGVLTVRGTVRCNHDAMFTELHVTAEGGRRDPGVGDTWWTASCAAPTTPWSVDIPGPFKPGKLSITTAGQFYDGWMTIYTPDETTVLTARRTR